MCSLPSSASIVAADWNSLASDVVDVATVDDKDEDVELLVLGVAELVLVGTEMAVVVAVVD